jgi:hypothetical protein
MLVLIMVSTLIGASCGNTGDDAYKGPDSTTLRTGEFQYTDSATSNMIGGGGNPDSSTQANPATDDRIERGAVGNDTGRDLQKNSTPVR